MRSIQVFFPDPVTGVLTMGFPNGHLASTTGVQNLLQNIVLYLRTKPGSDAFSPTRGSILGDPLGLSKALRDPKQLKVLVSDAVSQTQFFIIQQQEDQRQAGDILSLDETLTQLELNDVFQGDDPTTVFVEILVHTAGNKQFVITV